MTVEWMEKVELSIAKDYCLPVTTTLFCKTGCDFQACAEPPRVPCLFHLFDHHLALLCPDSA